MPHAQSVPVPVESCFKRFPTCRAQACPPSAQETAHGRVTPWAARAGRTLRDARL